MLREGYGLHRTLTQDKHAHAPRRLSETVVGAADCVVFARLGALFLTLLRLSPCCRGVPGARGVDCRPARPAGYRERFAHLPRPCHAVCHAGLRAHAHDCAGEDGYASPARTLPPPPHPHASSPPPPHPPCITIASIVHPTCTVHLLCCLALPVTGDWLIDSLAARTA